MTNKAGLTSREVAERVAAGKVNSVDQRTSRTVGAIVRENVFTRFNAILSTLLVVILVYGDLRDALFGFVMIINSMIGIVQEVRAKRTLDSLRDRITPRIFVVRDAQEHEIASNTIVLDDVVVISAGDAVPVDGVITDSDGLEVDESSLTGESDPVTKMVGDEIRSGSAVMAGSGSFVVTAVGADAWVQKLNKDAREFTLTDSGLKKEIDRLLGWIVWAIVPVGVLLFVTQVGRAESLASALVSTVSGLVAMIPQGLVLLVSMSFAVAAVRLARQSVVVQELAAVEGLARVDVVCLDKTGTLTTGELTVESIECFGADREAVLEGLAVLTAIERNPTATMQVISKVVAQSSHDPQLWDPTVTVPFSSGRKWSGASFDGSGTWIMGAPEVLLDAMGASASDVAQRVTDLASKGRRVLLVATSPRVLSNDSVLPLDMEPTAIVSIAEEIRPDAADTLRYLQSQGVTIKVISGDNPTTVAAIASEIGLPDAEKAIDMRGHEDVTGLAESNVVFGRVQPEQKRALVRDLQANGHTVAMTGDGVNDVLALKQSDIGIAMDTAGSATRAVSQLVLLDGRYDRLPFVLAEGRRVIANMERASALFITKTVYAILLAVSVSAAGFVFPFLPRHLTLVGTLTIGVPAFILSFWPSDSPARPGFLSRTMRFAVPAGLIATIVTFSIYALARSSLVHATTEEAQTAATLTLALVGFWILYRLIRPLNTAEAGLIGSMVVVLILAFTIPAAAEFFAIEFPTLLSGLAVAAATITAIVMLEFVLDMVERYGPTVKWFNIDGR